MADDLVFDSSHNSFEIHVEVEGDYVWVFENEGGGYIKLYKRQLHELWDVINDTLASPPHTKSNL